MSQVLVFTATYNEVDNIGALVADVFAALPDCHMMVVDDNSPDGTGKLLEELRATYPHLHAVHRPGKNGVGTAHKLAIKYAITHGYDALITMDADFSHDPKYLPEMVRQLESSEFVIGSRYAPGGTCEYPPSRVLLSRTANTLTRFLLGIPLHETTTSYRGFQRSLLERLNVDAIDADGYSYFVESIYQVSRLTRSKEKATPNMTEFPIRFVDRRAGTTKISKKEIWNGFTTLSRLALKRAATKVGILKPTPLRADEPQDLQPCSVCGCIYHVEEYAASNAGLIVGTYACTSTGHASHGRIVQCLGCSLVYTNPQMPQTEMLSMYSQVEDQAYLENADARVETFTYNLDQIKEFLPASGRLLDLGSYSGVFLQIARERGYEVQGVEPSTWASQYARDAGLPTTTGSIEDLPANTEPFDIVCSWDVLEHVSEPMTELKRVNKRLRHGGMFAFSTLDYGNWFPRLAGERWPWMMDMHLYYFDQKVMKQMLEAAGFRLVHTQTYCHIITLPYLMRKLSALGAPGAELARSIIEKTPAKRLYIPFRFGDIQMFVCEKVRDVAVTAAGIEPELGAGRLRSVASSS